MLISLTNLAAMCKIWKNIWNKVRLESLIDTNSKEWQNKPPFMIKWSMNHENQWQLKGDDQGEIKSNATYASHSTIKQRNRRHVCSGNDKHCCLVNVSFCSPNNYNNIHHWLQSWLKTTHSGKDEYFHAGADPRGDGWIGWLIAIYLLWDCHNKNLRKLEIQ